jgi:hypothetical protein
MQRRRCLAEDVRIPPLDRCREVIEERRQEWHGGTGQFLEVDLRHGVSK